MEWQDLVNGAFELVGGVFSWLNVRRLWRDKIVSGVSVSAWAIFALWGVWNLYYYSHLGQIASLIGGVTLVLANVVWLVLALHYKQQHRRTRSENILHKRLVVAGLSFWGTSTGLLSLAGRETDMLSSRGEAVSENLPELPSPTIGKELP